MTPFQVVAGVLRHRNEGDTDATARRIVAALSGHQMLADGNAGTAAVVKPAAAKGKQAGPVARCANPEDPHRGTELVGGHCPICQWSVA